MRGERVVPVIGPSDAPTADGIASLGVVVIGRNEGERLVRCLDSLARHPVVYVDSGSVDASVEEAAGRGAEVVQLDPSEAFTAARARNAGFAALDARLPSLEFVQFVDGDCEIARGWIETAVAFLRANPDTAVVCGRRRERAPDASPYNRLTDIEWDTPVGEAQACGGDALMRAEAFRRLGGFDGSLIAGEEPELCLRLRRDGYRVFRLDAEMTMHDAQMDRFSQWWRRQVRAGHAYAEACWLHGRSRERFRVRELVSAACWAVGLPTAGIVLSLAVGPALGVSLVVGAWVSLAARIAARRMRRGDPRASAWLYGWACVASKLATIAGACVFLANRLRGARTRLIEYKAPGPGS